MLEFKPYILREWVDIKIESGFIREYNNKKYYYDKTDKLINVKVIYSYPSFHTQKKRYKIRY